MSRTKDYILVTDNSGAICTDNDSNELYTDYIFIFTNDGTLALHVHTVEVTIINGVFHPCFQCHWYSECVVPRDNFLQNIKLGAVRPYYKCEDYTSKTP